MTEVYKIMNEVRNLRISKTNDLNFGEILVEDFDDGFVHIPAFVNNDKDLTEGEDGLLDLFLNFKIPKSILEQAAFEDSTMAKEIGSLKIAIKFNGNRINDMLTEAYHNKILKFGSFFLDLKPTERLNLIREQGYFVIVYF